MDIYYEKSLKKEREKEDNEYKDKDIIVTAAYKRKLMEDRKWLEDQKKKELDEEKNDVKKNSDYELTFLKNFLKDS